MTSHSNFKRISKTTVPSSFQNSAERMHESFFNVHHQGSNQQSQQALPVNISTTEYFLQLNKSEKLMPAEFVKKRSSQQQFASGQSIPKTQQTSPLRLVKRPQMNRIDNDKLQRSSTPALKHGHSEALMPTMSKLESQKRALERQAPPNLTNNKRFPSQKKSRKQRMRDEFLKLQKQHPNIQFGAAKSRMTPSIHQLPKCNPTQMRTTYNDGEPKEIYTRQIDGSWSKSPVCSPIRSNSAQQQRVMVGQSIGKNQVSPNHGPKRPQSTLKVSKTAAINHYYKTKVNMQRHTDQLINSQQAKPLGGKLEDLFDHRKPEIRVEENKYDGRRVITVQVVVPDSHRSENLPPKVEVRPMNIDEQGGSSQQAPLIPVVEANCSEEPVQISQQPSSTRVCYKKLVKSQAGQELLQKRETSPEKRIRKVDIQNGRSRSQSPTAKHLSSDVKRLKKKFDYDTRGSKNSMIQTPKKSRKKLEILDRIRQIAASKNIGIPQIQSYAQPSIEKVIESRSKKSIQVNSQAIQINKKVLIQQRSVKTLVKSTIEEQVKPQKMNLPLTIKQTVSPKFPVLPQQEMTRHNLQYLSTKSIKAKFKSRATTPNEVQTLQDNDDVINIDKEGMVANLSMSNKKPRYEDTSSSARVIKQSEKSDYTKSGIGKSMYEEKRATIKQQLFGQHSQENSKSQKQLKQSMLRKFSQNHQNKTKEVKRAYNSRQMTPLLNSESKVASNMTDFVIAVNQGNKEVKAKDERTRASLPVGSTQVPIMKKQSNAYQADRNQGMPAYIDSANAPTTFGSNTHTPSKHQIQVDYIEEQRFETGKNSEETLQITEDRPNFTRQSSFQAGEVIDKSDLQIFTKPHVIIDPYRSAKKDIIVQTKVSRLNSRLSSNQSSPKTIKSFASFGSLKKGRGRKSPSIHSELKMKSLANDHIYPNDSVVSSVFQTKDGKQSTKNEQGQLRFKQHIHSDKKQSNQVFSSLTSSSAIPKQLLSKLQKHNQQIPTRAPIQQTELLLIDIQRPIASYSKMPSNSPFLQQEPQRPLSNSRSLNVMQQIMNRKKIQSAEDQSRRVLTTNFQVVGTQKPQNNPNDQVIDFLNRVNQEKVIHEQIIMATEQDLELDPNATVTQSQGAILPVNFPQSPESEKSSPNQRNESLEYKLFKNLPEKNSPEKVQKIKKIGKPVLMNILESKSVLKTRPKTPVTPTKKKLLRGDYTSPSPRKLSTGLKQVCSALKLEHDIMQAVQAEQKFSHLQMSEMLSKSHSGFTVEQTDMEVNPRLRELAMPRLKIMKEVRHIVRECPNAAKRKDSPTKKVVDTTREEERDIKLRRRLEVFYTFTGLLAPKRLVEFIKTTELAELEEQQINNYYLTSDGLQQVQQTVKQAFFKQETLPSFCDRDHRDTYRLHYKRRHSFELKNLVIVKASDLLLRIEHEYVYNNQKREIIHIRHEGIEMVTQLCKTNQVVLLVDFANLEITSWAVQSVLVGHMKLSFDAIYAYSSSLAKPSNSMIDISQIVLDFRLYSEFQLRQKQTLCNPTMFVFVEARNDSNDGQFHSRLSFNDKQGHGYTHVSLGCNEDITYKFSSLLDFIESINRDEARPETIDSISKQGSTKHFIDYSNQYSTSQQQAKLSEIKSTVPNKALLKYSFGIVEQELIFINKHFLDMIAQFNESKREYILKQSTKQITPSPGTISRKEFNVLSDLRRRNFQVYNSRSRYSTSYRANEKQRANRLQKVDSFLLGQGADAVMTNLNKKSGETGNDGHQESPKLASKVLPSKQEKHRSQKQNINEDLQHLDAYYKEQDEVERPYEVQRSVTGEQIADLTFAGHYHLSSTSHFKHDISNFVEQNSAHDKVGVGSEQKGGQPLVDNKSSPWTDSVPKTKTASFCASETVSLSYIRTKAPFESYELVKIGEPVPEELHMKGQVLVASRTSKVKEPGNMLSWMSDDLDVKLTLAEERLTQLKSMRKHYLHFRCNSEKCFDELRCNPLCLKKIEAVQESPETEESISMLL